MAIPPQQEGKAMGKITVGQQNDRRGFGQSSQPATAWHR
jgi:hypothetical protein